MTHGCYGKLEFDEPPEKMTPAWLQYKALEVVESKIFGQVIMFFILASSFMMAVARADKKSGPVAEGFEFVFSAVFVLEALIKLTAYRLHYFHSAWNILDIFIVIESLVSLFSHSDGVEGIKVLRVFRVLRPLRTAHHLPAVKVIIEAMIKSLPTVWNVLLVYFLFLVVSAMIATSLFGGKLSHRCINSTIADDVAFDDVFFENDLDDEDVFIYIRFCQRYRTCRSILNFLNDELAFDLGILSFNPLPHGVAQVANDEHHLCHTEF